MAQINNSSVQSILKQTTSVIDAAMSSEYNDLRSLGRTLLAECGELKVLFNDNPGSAEVIKKKIRVEQLAIRLEFLVIIRVGFYVERRNNRREAEEIYLVCKSIMKLINESNTDTQEFLDWVLLTRWALKYYNDSRHIGFEKDDVDAANIEKVKTSPLYTKYRKVI